MPDLRTNSLRMNELMHHAIHREAVAEHFYCDARGLVTIGVGHLVDARNPLDGERLAARFARGNAMHFFRAPAAAQRGPVLADDVMRDWRRVKQYGIANPRWTDRAYERVAALRLVLPHVMSLLRDDLTTYANELFAKRPFAIHLDERIQMAIVDVRYNPAGVALYGSRNRDLVQMWNALNHTHPAFNLRRALELFTRIWMNRGGSLSSRYGQRHQLRVGMFRQGVEAMERQRQPRVEIIEEPVP
jgi:hypothetical protein